MCNDFLLMSTKWLAYFAGHYLFRICNTHPLCWIHKQESFIHCILPAVSALLPDFSLRIPRTICISFQFMIPANLGATLHIAFLLARALMYCVGCISYSSLTRSHLSGNRLASVVIISKLNLHSDLAHSKILCRNTSFRKSYFKMSDCFRIFAHSCSAFRDQSHLNDG